jgi:hypothetical protein
MAKFTGKEARALADAFVAQKREIFGDIEMEIVPKENAVDAMLMLRMLDNADKGVEAIIPVAKAMLGGTTVAFRYGTTLLAECKLPESPSFETVFADKPYLLQALFDTVYGIVLGKLQVPSGVLKRHERRLEAGEAQADGPSET